MSKYVSWLALVIAPSLVAPQAWPDAVALREQGRFGEALEAHRAALALLAAGAARTEELAQLGETEMRRGDYTAARRALEPIAAEFLPPRLAARVGLILGQTLFEQGNPRAAAAVYADALKKARAAAAADLEARLLYRQARLARADLRYSEAEAVNRLAAEVAARVADPAIELPILIDRGLLARSGSSDAEAFSAYRDARRQAIVAALPRLELEALFEEMSLEFRHGRVRVAATLATEGIALSRKAGLLDELGIFQRFYGETIKSFEPYRAALAVLDEALRTARRTGYVVLEIGTLRTMAPIHNSMGEQALAVEAYQAARQLQLPTGAVAAAVQTEADIASFDQSPGAVARFREATRKTLDAVTAAGLSHEAAWAWNSLSSRDLDLGLPEQALEEAQRAADFFKEKRDLYCWARSLLAQSAAQQAVKGYGPSIVTLEEARHHFEGIGDAGNLASVVNSLAIRHSESEYASRSESEYRQAQDIYRDLGDLRNLSLMISNVAIAHSAQGKYEAAVREYRDSVALRRRLEDPSALAFVLNNLGVGLRNVRRFDESIQNGQEALEIYRRIGDLSAQANVLVKLSDTEQSRNRYPAALGYLRKALDLRKALGKPTDIAAIQREIGLLYQSQRSYATAMSWYDRALAECGGTDRLCHALTYETMGGCENTRGRFDVAVTYYESALQSLETLDQALVRSRIVNLLGDVYTNKGSYGKAVALYSEDLKFVRRLGMRVRLANRLLDLAGALSEKGSYDEAASCAQESLQIRRGLEDPDAVASALDQLGDIHQAGGDARAAIVDYRQELDIRRRMKDTRGVSLALHQIGDALSDVGEYQPSLDYHRQGLKIREQNGLKTLLPRSHQFIGQTYKVMGLYTEALGEFQTAITLGANRSENTSILTDMGETMAKLDRYSEALNAFGRALKLAEESGDNEYRAKVLTQRARVYLMLKQYENAVADLQDNLNLGIKMDDESGRAEIYDDMAEVDRARGRYVEALTSHDKAIEFAVRTHDAENTAEFLLCKAITLRRAGKPTEARVVLDRALSSAAQDDKVRRATIFQEMGVLLREKPELGDAEPWLQKALALALATDDYDTAADINSEIGQLWLGRKQYGKARASYLLVRDITRRMSDTFRLAQAEYNLGVVAESEGNPAEALKSFLAAIRIRESIRTASSGAEVRTSVADLTASYYGRAIDLLIAGKEFREAFELAERARARTLLDQLAGGPSRPADSAAPGADERLYQQLAAVEKDLDALRRNLSGPAAGERMTALLRKREKLANDYDEALRKVSASSAAPASVSVEPLRLDALQRKVPAGWTLLAYYLTRKNTLAFVISRDIFQSFVLPEKPARVHSEVQALLPWAREFGAADRRRLAQLYRMLIAPVRSALKTQALGVIPHGVLHLLPFAALDTGSGDMADRFTLFTLPSASAVGALDRELKSAATPFLAFSKSDPEGVPARANIDREAADLSRLFGTREVTNASLEDLRQKAGSARIVHLAAHAILDTNNPAHSAILLRTPAYATDLQRLSLPAAELVTISACQTQGGALSDSDDSVSLHRAFLISGARSVLASFWQVDDLPTREFMLQFYNGLKLGLGKADSLAAAQKVIRARYPHPMVWAAFALTGDPGPIRGPAAPARIVPLLAGAAATAIAFLAVLKRRSFARVAPRRVSSGL